MPRESDRRQSLLWGESALPSEWLDALEARQVIERLADDFAAHFFDWEHGRQAPDDEAYLA